MSQTYSYRAVGCGGGIHGLGWVCFRMPACKDARQQPSGARRYRFRLWCEMEVNVFRPPWLRLEAKETVPGSAWRMRVVVAWDQVPLNSGKGAHPFDWLAEGSLGRGFDIENITRDQNCRCILGAGKLSYSRDGFEALIAQELGRFIGESEGLSDLPVGSVYESHASYYTAQIFPGHARLQFQQSAWFRDSLYTIRISDG